MTDISYRDYWISIHRLAWASAFVGPVPSLKRTVIGFVLGSLGAYIFLGLKEMIDEWKILFTWGLVASFGTHLFYYVSNFIAAPARLNQEKQEKIDSLAELTRPKFQLWLDDETGVERLLRGAAATSFSGMRQSNIAGVETYVRVRCRNPSSTTINNCEAYMFDLYELDRNGDVHEIGFNESIRLSWSKDLTKKQFARDMQPGVKSNIYVVKQISNNITDIFGEEVPFDYRHIFMEKNSFLAIIQVSGENTTPTKAAIEIYFDDDGLIEAKLVANPDIVPKSKLRSAPSAGFNKYIAR